MEDTMTKSCQNFWSGKHCVFALSLASAFSVNAIVHESTANIPADNSCVFIQQRMNYMETFGTDKTYSFTKKKNFRDRYKRIAQSEWFKNTHSGMSVGEVMAIEE